MNLSIPSLPTLAIAVVAVTGCAGAPVYRLHPGRVHKDLIVCNVQLSAPLDADEYARIATEELHGLLTSPVAAPEKGVPLYEVRFEFLVSHPKDDRYHKVATVRFNLLAASEPPQIILYPAVF